MINYRTIKGNEGGFTLLEAMIAMVVLSIGVFSLQQMQIATIQGNATAQSLTTGTIWASDRAERLFRLAYTDPLVGDTDNDGNAGLGDTAAGGVVTADFLFTQNALGIDVVTQGGNAVPANSIPYFVYWNVAVDSVVPNTRTIRVITVWNDRGQQKTTVVDHVKPSAL